MKFETKKIIAKLLLPFIIIAALPLVVLKELFYEIPRSIITKG